MHERRKGKPRIGTAVAHGDHYDIRITFPDGSRSKLLCQPPTRSEVEARAEALRLSKLAEDEGIVGPPKRRPHSNVLAEAPADETFEQWVERWCDAREERGLTSVDDD